MATRNQTSNDAAHRQRLVDIWRRWETAYREPVDGWAGAERFRSWFEHERDELARHANNGTRRTLTTDAELIRWWLAAGGDLRIALRGVDNMAEDRAQLLCELDALIDDLHPKRTSGRQRNLRLSDELVREIDRLRGAMPRERLLRAVVTRWVMSHRDSHPEQVAAYVAETGVFRELDEGSRPP